MFEIVNPYQALAFYRNRSNESKRCPIYCPSFLPGFQIAVASDDANFALSYVDTTNNEVPIVSPNFTDTTIDGQRVITYVPNVSVFTSEGIYQLKFTSDQVTYWSHALAFRKRFDQLVQSVSCAGSSANFEIRLTTKGCDYALWELDAGSGFVRIGQDTGIVDSALMGVRSGAVSVPVRCTFVTETETVVRNYNLTYTGEDPCSDAALTQTSEDATGRQLFKYCRLVFSHDKDMEEKNIYYNGTSFTQAFSFVANFGHSSRIEEEGFQTLSDGALSFDYANEADQINIDIFPMPDYLLNGLNHARYHSTCQIIDAQTGTDILDIQNFKLIANDVEGSDCQRGTMTFEINRVYSKV